MNFLSDSPLERDTSAKQPVVDPDVKRCCEVVQEAADVLSIDTRIPTAARFAIQGILATAIATAPDIDTRTMIACAQLAVAVLDLSFAVLPAQKQIFYKN